MKQYILKVQPVKKLMIHIKEKNISFLEKIHGISKGKKNNVKIGGDNAASVEEEEISPSTRSVGGSDVSVREFDVSTCSGDNVYDIF